MPDKVTIDENPINEKVIVNKVVTQTIAGEEFKSNEEPEVYEVATVVNVDSPLNSESYSNSFSKEKIKESEKEINEINNLENELNALNQELTSTKDAKQINKLNKKIESIQVQKIEKELELAVVYMQVNENELSIERAKIAVVKEQSMALVNDSYEFKQAEAYETAGDELINQALALREEAGIENDLVKKNELLVKATNSEIAAVEKLSTAKKLYSEALIEDVSIAASINPEKPSSKFNSNQISNKANVANENAISNENRAIELRVQAEKAKPSEKSTLLFEATKLEELAKEEKALSEQLLFKANRVKLYEQAVVEQQQLAANLSEEDAIEVFSTKEYEAYYKQELEINELSSTLKTIEAESNAYEDLFKQQTIKANSYFNKAISEEDPEKETIS